MTSKFPATFWTANTIELFERAAYYAIASFVVVYLNENLGMAPTKATFLNGTLLWGLIYFLPILSGTLADRFGFKRSLVLAFVLISLGYFTMGSVQKFWPALSGVASGGVMFEQLIINPASQNQPIQAPLMWFLVGLMGVISMTGLYLYDRYLIKK